MSVRTTIEKGNYGSVKLTQSRRIGPPKAPKPGELQEATYRRKRRQTSFLARMAAFWGAFRSMFKRRAPTHAENVAANRLAAENFRKAHPHCIAHVFKAGKMSCWPPGTYGIPRDPDGSYIRTDCLPEHMR